MTTETLTALNLRRHAALDRYRGAFLGLAVADHAAAEVLFARCEALLRDEDVGPLEVDWPEGPLLGALLALWCGGDLHAATTAVALRQASGSARSAAAMMALILAETPPAAFPSSEPQLDEVVEALTAAPNFEAGALRVDAPGKAVYGILAGAAFGESGLPAPSVAALPHRGLARALAGALFERVWTPPPPDAPEVVCEHCRSLLERASASPMVTPRSGPFGSRQPT